MVLTRSDADAERFAALGIAPERIRTAGNIKYDLAPPAVDRDAVRARLGVTEPRPILVAGSTGDGEEPAHAEFLHLGAVDGRCV